MMGFINALCRVDYERLHAKIRQTCGLIAGCNFFNWKNFMGNKIVTEADRQRAPKPVPLPGTMLRTGGRGQRVSLERGVATRSKKNPGKRSNKGG
jgi:hypothetical protein